MIRPIYLDYAATTPVDARVAETMMHCLTMEGNFGNPASRSHYYGWQAEEAIETAREQVADLIGADEREIVWTSGATESINLAVKGAAEFYKTRGNHIITSKIEHKATLDTCRELEEAGFEVTYLDPEPITGMIYPAAVQAAFKENTILVSLMMVNNEIGTITDIAAIGQMTRARNIILHVDAAQATGKVDIDVQSLAVDLLSMSAHKTYGPKGVGALFVSRKPRVRIKAQMHGGGHERGMRSGTLPTHQIAGMGQAFAIAKQQMHADNVRIGQLRDRLWQGVIGLQEVHLNGDPVMRVPHHLNCSFNFVEGESLMMALKGVAVSSGSACTSASLEPSYVLRALGLSDELAHSSIRFSIGRYTTEAQVDEVIAFVNYAVDKLRALSPLWDMHQEGIDLATVKWNTH